MRSVAIAWLDRLMATLAASTAALAWAYGYGPVGIGAETAEAARASLPG